MRQSFRDFSVLVIDNGSEDGTVQFIRENYPTVSILQNFRNLGYSKANNQGIAMAQSEYVLVVNPDVILEENFLKEIVQSADKHPEAGSFSGKVLKLFSESIDSEDESGLRKVIKSDFIDSTGLQIYKSRKIGDRGEGQKDVGQYSRPEEVFGFSGACVLYRADALKDVMIKNEYFDNDFFAYKEDIDLAWRLRLYGWTAWYNPLAVCFHRRSFAGFTGKGFKKTVLSRRDVSKKLRSISFKNHYLVMIKNEQWTNLILHSPRILIRELGLIFYSLIFEPFKFLVLPELFSQLPGALIKRKVIMSHHKTPPRVIREWLK